MNNEERDTIKEHIPKIIDYLKKISSAVTFIALKNEDDESETIVRKRGN